ncbi:MAG: GWxTD domain-containing protein [Melioribacteraceae bacterium]|nr:GWxTD domain-containing protein [Melioribacteraceae bacterium]
MKKITKYGLLLIITQTIALICAAQQDLPTNSGGDIQFYVDDASFFNQGKIYQEFYLVIYTDQLKLAPKNNSMYADLTISSVIKNSQREIINKESWNTEVHVGLDSELIETSIVHDQWSRNLDAGKYYLELEVKDNITGKLGTARREFSAALNSDRKIFISEIEFASEFIPDADGAGIFDKGSVSVIPNPSRRYGLLNPILYFYYEIYGADDDLEKEFQISYEILEKNGTSLRSFEGKTIKLSGVTVGVPNGLNVSVVASGIYTLVVKLNHNETVVAESSREFEVIQLDYLKKEPLLTREQADMFGEIIRLISTERNYQTYENLNLTAKAKYLIEFWRQNDPHPFTDENELFNRVVQRYQYANKNFSWGGIDGWKTDRGKILIKYGMPDNIQRFASQQSTSPYEIWEYQARRNYIYVFGDLRSDGRYTLLHSTKEDEINNPYWKEELNRM